MKYQNDPFADLADVFELWLGRHYSSNGWNNTRMADRLAHVIYEVIQGLLEVNNVETKE